MNGIDYQLLAMRTNDGKSTHRLCRELDVETDNTGCFHIGDLLNACLGLSGEVGELNDIVKKAIFHEKKLDENHLKKELGDVMWYIAMFCSAMEWDLDEILEMNIEKLMARYPEGFDTVRANNRKAGDI